MKFVKHYGYDIGFWSYLPKDIMCSSYLTFKEETVELMDKYFGKPNNLEVIEALEQPVDENDSCYHNFMRGLQLLEILHTAWLMFDDLVLVSIT